LRIEEKTVAADKNTVNEGGHENGASPVPVAGPEKKKPDQSARGWPKDPGNSE
jgi:hypothetical protein